MRLFYVSARPICVCVNLVSHSQSLPGHNGMCLFFYISIPLYPQEPHGMGKTHGKYWATLMCGHGMCQPVSLCPAMVSVIGVTKCTSADCINNVYNIITQKGMALQQMT